MVYRILRKIESPKNFKAWIKAYPVSQAEMFPICIIIQLSDTTSMYTSIYFMHLFWQIHDIQRSCTGVWLKTCFCFLLSICLLQWLICCPYKMCTETALNSCWPLRFTLGTNCSFGQKLRWVLEFVLYQWGPQHYSPKPRCCIGGNHDGRGEVKVLPVAQPIKWSAKIPSSETNVLAAIYFERPGIISVHCGKAWWWMFSCKLLGF